MGIFEKPPGSGVWWILYYAAGKRHREKVGSKRLAQAAYEQRKTETRQGKFSADLVQPKQRLVLDTLLEKYQPHFLALRSPEQHKRPAVTREQPAVSVAHSRANKSNSHQNSHLEQMSRPANRHKTWLPIFLRICV